MFSYAKVQLHKKFEETHQIPKKRFQSGVLNVFTPPYSQYPTPAPGGRALPIWCSQCCECVLGSFQEEQRRRRMLRLPPVITHPPLMLQLCQCNGGPQLTLEVPARLPSTPGAGQDIPRCYEGGQTNANEATQ